MFFKSNPSAPAPIYVQLTEQVRHAVEVGALKPNATYVSGGVLTKLKRPRMY